MFHKDYFFFMISCKIVCKNGFNVFFLFFYEFTKIKSKSFECPKSIRNHEKNKAWNIRHLVDESFIPATQQTRVLYCRLSDFRAQGNSMTNLMLKKLVDLIIKPYLNADFMAKKALSENTKILACVETIQKSALKYVMPKTSFGLFQLSYDITYFSFPCVSLTS